MVEGGNVYFIRDGLGSLKIGFAKDVIKRKKMLQTANPNELEVFAVWHVPNMYHAYEIESYLHSMFCKHRKRGEWFEESAVIEYLRHGDLEVPGYRFENITW